MTGIFFLLPAGGDFSGVDQVFELNSTQHNYTFNITIVNDNLVEGPENFFVNLTHLTQVELIEITPDMVTVNTADDDGK